MNSFILIIYLSAGFGMGATGGPAVISGYASEADCVTDANRIANATGKKFDWYRCVPSVQKVKQ